MRLPYKIKCFKLHIDMAQFIRVVPQFIRVVLTTNGKPTVIYSIPDEIPTTYFQLCELV